MAFESSSIGESFRMLLPGGIVRQCSVWFRALGMAMFAIAVLGACGGSHDTASSLLPALWTNAKFGHGKALAAVGTAGSDIVAINAGGSAAGSFAADTDYAATSTWTYATTSTITTSAISNAAPQAVYQTEREGSSIGYTIPGLTPGATYTVRLSFAELWWTAAGQRVFNVSINGAKVLSNFDIFATAGGRNKADGDDRDHVWRRDELRRDQRGRNRHSASRNADADADAGPDVGARRDAIDQCGRSRDRRVHRR
jgi:hypothetical protein